jgi:hypothetical protein
MQFSARLLGTTIFLSERLIFGHYAIAQMETAGNLPLA